MSYPKGITAISRWLSEATPPANSSNPFGVKSPMALSSLRYNQKQFHNDGSNQC